MLLNIAKVRVYGVVQHYVVDEEVGENIAMLIGQRTLQDKHLEALEALGFTLVIGDSVDRPAWVRERYPSRHSSR